MKKRVTSRVRRPKVGLARQVDTRTTEPVSFRRVSTGATLTPDVKQTGNNHRVHALLLHGNKTRQEWRPHEIEDQRVSCVLNAAGRYWLFVYVLFFGTTTESVHIRLSVQDVTDDEQSQHIELAGRGRKVHQVMAMFRVT